VPLDAPIETKDGAVQRDIEDAGLDPLQRLIAAESRQTLDEAIEELPAGHRAVFVLRDVEKLSTEETAKVLGITVPAVKSRLHRTRLALKEKLLRAAGREAGTYGPGRDPAREKGEEIESNPGPGASNQRRG